MPVPARTVTLSTWVTGVLSATGSPLGDRDLALDAGAEPVADGVPDDLRVGRERSLAGRDPDPTALHDGDVDLVGRRGSARWTTSIPPAGSTSLASTSTIVEAWPKRVTWSGIATGSRAGRAGSRTSTRMRPGAMGALPYAAS